jgi:hypothetical protein
MRCFALVSLLVLLPSRGNAEPIQVDAVFVLDTTASMSGLIDGAKRQIWFIANQLLKATPRPVVRIGLVGYRDHGDEYVTRQYPLTDSIDDVHSQLMRFVAAGGGDEPEHVNRALQVAIERMSWRRQGPVLRLIFLVGDAPPHEGRDGLRSATLAPLASKAGIIINTVLCGDSAATERSWRSIAAAASGSFVKIPHDGAMKQVPSPVDRYLARFNHELSQTAIPTGDEQTVLEARRRLDWNRTLGVHDQAESATFRARSGRLDAADLLYLLGKGRKLREIPDAQLPRELRELSVPEREALLKRIAARRAVLNETILRLAKERDAYRQKLSNGQTSFDASLRNILRQQGARVGLSYR